MSDQEFLDKTYPSPDRAGLRYFKPGVSGNPTGRRTGNYARPFRLALRQFFFNVPLRASDDEVGKAMTEGERASKFKDLFETYYDTAMELIPKCKNVGQLIAFVPFLIYIRDTIDGKDETSKEQIKEASTVFMSAEGIKRTMNKITASKMVTKETFQEDADERNNH